jgi:hypothetical protein
VGNLEIDVLQVVDARAANNDGFAGHLRVHRSRRSKMGNSRLGLVPTSVVGGTAEAFYYKGEE